MRPPVGQRDGDQAPGGQLNLPKNSATLIANEAAQLGPRVWRGDLPPGFAVLKAVASHPLDSLSGIDLTGVDLNTRRKFIGKPIWDDFIAHRAPLPPRGRAAGDIGAAADPLLGGGCVASGGPR